ncbi:Hint domain-containing protein [Pseudorhodobacter sp.]|uniref:Hint domain-containing protein n=1 Tax=Pseudorhodobacter sp. TaxID=1934400 RepID=UPI002647C9A4|nr:Hint domain-containing protein [Pseudorhodobacter sp.]MDN5786855.1 Hint domain-containing protein [Pseudorhodobacter sp.]
MPNYTLSYVYQLSDFLTTGGNVAPPQEKGADAQGTPPFSLTLSGGAGPQRLHLSDDDPNFNEVGDKFQLLTAPITIDGVTYAIGTSVIINYVITTNSGFSGYSITLGEGNTANNTTTAFITNTPMTPGLQYVFTSEANIGNGSVPYAQLACFTPGTMIATPAGEARIEDLRPGDLVETRDNGPQVLRWIGQKMVAGIGAMAQIHIAQGVLGATRDLIVSPNHRVVVEGYLPELLTGELEMFVAAKHLTNGRTIKRKACGWVTYIHLLFDRHEVLRSNGVASESFYLGAQAERCNDPDQAAELKALFPAFFADNAARQPCLLARPEARRIEGRLIAAAL